MAARPVLVRRAQWAGTDRARAGVDGLMPDSVRRVLRWAPLVVVAGEAVLVISGWLGAAEAALVLVVLEALLAAVLGANALTFGRALKRRRSGGVAGWRAFELSLREVLPPPLAAMVGHELGMFHALWLALRRKVDVPPGAVPLGYGQELRPLMAAVAGACVLEIGVVAVLVGLLVPWPVVGWVLLIVSVYGLLWILSFRAALGVLPHVVGPSTLRLRFATFADIAVPLALVADVSAQRTRGHRKTVAVQDGVLTVSVMGRANTRVALKQPYAVELKGTRAEITQVRFFADDPGAAVRRVAEAAQPGHLSA